LAGELASLEDLVLREAGMDIRAPSTGVVRAARVLTERRSLARRASETVLAPQALRRPAARMDWEKALSGLGGRIVIASPPLWW
jgi:hypothetical protein